MMQKMIEEQRDLLARPVHPKFVKTDTNVRGKFTTGDYVKVMLNTIFGPDNWSHTILSGPEIIRLNESYAYAQVTVRLTVQFANGQQVTHDDIGVWPLSASKESTLDDTRPERFETVTKAAITDAVKGCSEYLGVCFRPLSDQDLETYLRARQGAIDERTTS